MAIFKCKMCGGDLTVDGVEKVVECDYCCSKQTIPDTNDEKRVNLYNRANRLRMSCEFDKASSIYEQIIAEFPEEAEAYWGLCLCNYGIEYVDDPLTAQKIPTCHRASFDKMRKDENYELALENADMTARIVYEDQAKEIDRIMGDILSVSRNEQPYDIFICYKETDNSGERTPDSVLAQDIYDALTAKSYRVFFSRITLEDKLGTQYEPYIFSALNSAKMMLVVGTDYEYMNAVWVKNEWSRFLKIIAKDKSRMLIPCYQDMDPYDMPDEFRGLQSQDCSKLGFMQDLIRGIDKLFGKGAETKPVEKVIVQQNGSSATVDSLLERAFLFLEDGKWQDANVYCEKVLDIAPKNAEAYLGKLMAELKVKIRKQLADCKAPFDDRDIFSKVLRFGNEALENEMRGYIAHINDRNENARLTGIYENAQREMRNAQSAEALKEAANLFKTIPGFKDADALAEQCLEQAEECRKKKEQLFSAIAEALTHKLNKGKAAYDKEQLVAAKKYAEAVAEIIRIFDDTQSEIETAARQKGALHAKIESLKSAHSSLGLFDGKQKKQLNSELAEAEQALSECAKTVVSLQKKLQGYTSKQKAESQLANLRESIRNMEEKIEKAQADGPFSLTYEEAMKALEDEGIRIEFLNRYPEHTDCILFARVGERIRFGNYFSQNKTSKEPIEWRVLAKEDNKILVISEYALDCQQYNTSFANVTWETCSLRKWMNSTFLNNAFSAEEQAQIQTTIVPADINPNYSTNPGYATTDKVFLLSITEANKYFTSGEDRECVPTAYAIAQGAWTSERDTKGGKTTCFWWLRSPGDGRHFVAYVYNEGSVLCCGICADSVEVCVRPALWINLDS